MKLRVIHVPSTISVAPRGHTINSSSDGASHNSSLIMVMVYVMRPHYDAITSSSLHASYISSLIIDMGCVTRDRPGPVTGKKDTEWRVKSTLFLYFQANFWRHRIGSKMNKRPFFTRFFDMFLPVCVSSWRGTLITLLIVAMGCMMRPHYDAITSSSYTHHIQPALIRVHGMYDAPRHDEFCMSTEPATNT